MLAASNFVNQMHNGTVNNNNNNPISDNLNNETTTTQMTSTKQAAANSFGPNVNNPLDSSGKIALSPNSESTNQISDSNGGHHHSEAAPENSQNNEDDSVDITISNVVTNFSVRCHLNLRQIATNGSNVVYRRDQSVSGPDHLTYFYFQGHLIIY